MPVELQMKEVALEALVARSVQQRLFTMCVGPFGTDYIDHADVANVPIVTGMNAGALHFHVAIDVFTVTRTDLLAAPNGVPSGAAGTGYRAGIDVQLAVSGTSLTLSCTDVDLQSLVPRLGPVAHVAESAIAAKLPPVSVDLAPYFDQIGLPAQTGARIERNGGIVAVRFSPVGPLISHLFAGQDWGVFVDGLSIEQIARAQVTAGLAGVMPLVNVSTSWQPVGTTPHVDVVIGTSLTIFGYSTTAKATFGCEFSLAPGPVQRLRLIVNWGIDVKTPPFVPAAVDREIRKKIEAAVDPAKFGAFTIDDRTFGIDEDLDPLEFNGAELRCSGVFASLAGMTIGGFIRLPYDVGQATLDSRVQQFGPPVRRTNCRQLAKSGSGDPDPIIRASEVTISASATLTNSGAFCSLEYISVPAAIEPFISVPAAGQSGGALAVVLQAGTALMVTAPVRLVIRTARGVRLIDLGTPPQLDIEPNGHVKNAKSWHIRNCNYINAEDGREHGINWGTVDVEQRDFVINPHDRIDASWEEFLERPGAVSLQLVTLTGLQAGELLQFRSPDHAVDVTADADGLALVPVLLPLGQEPPAGKLIRVNRQRMSGHFDVVGMTVQRYGRFEAGRQFRFVEDDQGEAVLTTEFAGRLETRRVGPLGVVTFVTGETALNPQPLPPGGGVRTEFLETRIVSSIGGAALAVQDAAAIAADDLDLATLNPQPLPPGDGITTIGRQPRPLHDTALPSGFNGQHMHLAGVDSFLAVPGFEDQPIAIAVMTDGSKLVINSREDGTPRVSGTFAGPVGAFETSGQWAFTSDATYVSLYRLIRS